MKHIIQILGIVSHFLLFISCDSGQTTTQDSRPNILLIISDDQSYPHASAYGYTAVNTPAFDYIAEQGVLFTNAYAPAPGCSPTRASILTGRHIWQIEEAGTHASKFPTKYKVYPDIFEENGYRVGFTGKPWGPGNWEISGRTRNPAGDEYRSLKMISPRGMSDMDYYGNFRQFLDQTDNSKPFCFWFGGHEAHRVYSQGIGEACGIDPEKIEVPEFLPDEPEIRTDIADYCAEIEWFDQHVKHTMDMLADRKLLENTIIVYTSDNGMPFPRAKANLYEFGIHMPLAIMWPKGIEKGQVVDALVSQTDFMPTFLEAANLLEAAEESLEYPMAGKSFLKLVSTESISSDLDSRAVFSGRERHSCSRWNNNTYPMRSLRKGDYLYIHNFKPERWPAGAPQKYNKNGTLEPMHQAYHDIDGGLSLSYLVNHANDPSKSKYLQYAVQKRPADELYNVKNDPACLINLAEDASHQETLKVVKKELMDYLEATGDPRMTGDGDVWETYPRYNIMREFPKPDWAQKE